MFSQVHSLAVVSAAVFSSRRAPLQCEEPNNITNKINADTKISFAHHNHGKGKVRVVKVFRETPDLAGKFGKINEDVRHYNVQTVLYGPVEESYTEGDNRKVVATDTQKNTCYCVARDNNCRSAEEYALYLAKHFLKQYPSESINQSCITIEEDIWSRIVDKDGNPHGHAFQKSGPCQKKVIATASRKPNGEVRLSLKSGLQNFTIMKTTNSSWCDFLRDEYTTLPDAKDRLLGSNMTIEWEYTEDFIKSCKPDFDWEAMAKKVQDTLTATFTGPVSTGVPSLGVQQTLHQMGYQALQDIVALDSIWISAPNLHNIPFDFSKLGRSGHGDVYVATTEPHGLIEVKLVRNGNEKTAEKGVQTKGNVQEKKKGWW